MELREHFPNVSLVSPSCRVTSFIGNKHSFGAIPNFSPFFAAVGSVLLEAYDSLRPVELFVARIAAAAFQWRCALHRFQHGCDAPGGDSSARGSWAGLGLEIIFGSLC